MSFFDIVLDFILMDAFEDLENPPSSVLAVLRNRWLSDSFKETVGGCPPHTLMSPHTLAQTLLSSVPGFGYQAWAPHPSGSSHPPGQVPLPRMMCGSGTQADQVSAMEPLPRGPRCSLRLFRTCMVGVFLLYCGLR